MEGGMEGGRKGRGGNSSHGGVWFWPHTSLGRAREDFHIVSQIRGQRTRAAVNSSYAHSVLG